MYLSRSNAARAARLALSIAAVTALCIPMAGCDLIGLGSAPSGTTGGVATRTVESTKTAAATRSVEASGPKLVTVPDVVGLDIEDAIDDVVNRDLGYTIAWHASWTRDAREVYKQSPEAGDEVDPGAVVRLYASIGRGPSQGVQTTDPPPQPKRGKWRRLTAFDHAWVLYGTGTGDAPSIYLPAGWAMVSAVAPNAIRVRMEAPNGSENIMVHTYTHTNYSPQYLPRLGRAKHISGGDYVIKVRAGWNEPWALVVMWQSTKPPGSLVVPAP